MLGRILSIANLMLVVGFYTNTMFKLSFFHSQVSWWNLHKLETRSQQIYILTPCMHMCNKNTFHIICQYNIFYIWLWFYWWTNVYVALWFKFSLWQYKHLMLRTRQLWEKSNLLIYLHYTYTVEQIHELFPWRNIVLVIWYMYTYTKITGTIPLH